MDSEKRSKIFNIISDILIGCNLILLVGALYLFHFPRGDDMAQIYAIFLLDISFPFLLLGLLPKLKSSKIKIIVSVILVVSTYLFARMILGGI